MNRMTYWGGIPLKPLTNDQIGMTKVIKANEIGISTALDETVNAALDFYQKKNSDKKHDKKKQEGKP